MTRMIAIIFLLFAGPFFSACTKLSPTMAPEGFRVVLLPISLPQQLAGSRVFLEASIAREFNKVGVGVVYGTAVDEVILRENQKKDCSAASCAEALSIEFNTPYLAAPDVEIKNEVSLLSLRIENPMSQEVVAVGTDTCSQCSAKDLASDASALVEQVTAQLFRQAGRAMPSKAEPPFNDSQAAKRMPLEDSGSQSLKAKSSVSRNQSVVLMGGM